MRLHKFLSGVGYCSRKQAEQLISTGKISINGRMAKVGDKVTGREDIVIGGKKLENTKPAPKKVILFNKPTGVECSLIKNPWNKTIMDFDFGADRVFPIGKLDQEAHGLLLITNDGELGNKLAGPDTAHVSEYIIVTKEPITQSVLEIFSAGEDNDNLKYRTGRLKQLTENSVQFVLLKGRIKHLKKVCDAAGVVFTDIQRTRFGSIGLGELALGEWRELDGEEVEYLSGDEPVKQTGRRIVVGNRKAPEKK